MRTRSRPCKLRPGQSVIFPEGTRQVTEVRAGTVSIANMGTFSIWDILSKLRAGAIMVRTCRFR
jgi:hypothetical protein